MTRGLALALAFVASTANAQGAQNIGWILEQESLSAGKQKVYITASAVKLVSASTGTTMLVKKPEWDVFLYNNHRKLAFKTDSKHWYGYASRIFSTVWSTRLNNIWPTGKVDDRLLGINCSKYTLRADAKGVTKENRNLHLDGAYYWSTDMFKLDKPATMAVQRYYQIPQIVGFPLQVHSISTHKVERSELTTISCAQAKLADSEFELPKDYQVTTKENEYFMDKNNKEWMNELLQDLP